MKHIMRLVYLRQSKHRNDHRHNNRALWRDGWRKEAMYYVIINIIEKYLDF
jgi:hypothetical protein